MYDRQIQSGEALTHVGLSPKNYCLFSEVDNVWVCLNCKRRIPLEYTAGVMPFAMCSNPEPSPQSILPVVMAPDKLGETVTRVNRAIGSDDETARKQLLYEQVIARGNKGVGAHLKRVLNRLGVETPASCSCNGKAKSLDLWGPDLCAEREDFISKWLLDEATKRLLPYTDAAGKRLLKVAIKRARKSIDKFERDFNNLVYG